jgi:hypothetical protein
VIVMSIKEMEQQVMISIVDVVISISSCKNQNMDFLIISKSLKSLYPSEPDVLMGDHKEAAIYITKVNEKGEYITLKSNNNQVEKGIEDDQQVFLYDEDAIKDSYRLYE